MLAFSPDTQSATLAALVSALAAPVKPAQALCLTEVQGTAAINVDDVNQGEIGDCLLLSPIGEIALLKPTFIASMIHVNSNGTETVILYEGSNGRLAALGKFSATPLMKTGRMSMQTYSIAAGSPPWAARSSANAARVLASLPSMANSTGTAPKGPLFRTDIWQKA
jgi:hypothetical protein